MKRLVTIPLVLILAAASPVAAQQYNDAETAVIERMTDCWDRFLGSWQSWYDECVHPDSHYWGAQFSSPVDADFYRRWYEVNYGTELTWVLADLRPVLVSVHGDVATTYFHSTWAWRDADGKMHQQDDMRLEVWIRDGGRWLLLRGMAMPLGAEN